MYKTII